MPNQTAATQRQKVVALLVKVSEPCVDTFAANGRQALCSAFGLKLFVHIYEDLEVAFAELHHPNLETGFRIEGGKRPWRVRGCGRAATRAASVRDLRNRDNTTYLRFPHWRHLPSFQPRRSEARSIVLCAHY